MDQKKHFDPARVGEPFYPLNEEAWQRRYDQLLVNAAKARAAGTLNRRGIPTGWARRRAELDAQREADTAEAKQLVAALRNSQTPDERLDANERRMSEAEMADLMLAEAIAIIRSPTTSRTDRLIACKAILPFLMTVPRRTRVGLADGLAFLDRLAQVALKEPLKASVGDTETA